MGKKVALLAVFLVPFVAVADNPVAYRIGPGAQMTCSSSVPTHVTTRGTVWCNSSDANKLYYTTPAGSSAAVTPGAPSIVSLTDGATINTDASLGGGVFSVTLGGDRTLANPTNMSAGATYLWIVTQDGTGSRTLSYGNKFKWPGGSAPTLTTTAAAVDLITAVYDGTNLRAVWTGDFR